MEQHLTQFVNAFSKAIKDNTAAIFAGAGLSAPAGFVNWRELMKDIAVDLNLDIDKENDLIAIAQYHFNEKGNNRHKLNQLLIEEFTQRTTLTPNHKLIAELPIQTYWTTNYDKLIEKAIEEAGRTPDVKISPESLSTNIPKRDAVVYKMHGDASLPSQAVLTKDDYEGYNENRALFTTALQGDLVSKTFLFIGFSFDDPNLNYILSRIRILLGKNQREHYCFFRKVSRMNYNSDEEFNYALNQFRLKINDLKRYSINALLVDDYPEINDVLTVVQKKVVRSNIFISGAAISYDPRTEEEALLFIQKLSYTLLSKGYKIVSGYGEGLGSSVVHGALEYIFTTNYRHIEDYLILRPFPIFNSERNKIEESYTKYRCEMLKNSGLAIFIFGNKYDEKGDIVISKGMIEEFELGLKMGVIPIPIGATGFASEEIWNRLMKNPEDYYTNNKELLDAIKELGDKSLTFDEIIKKVL
jgi:hypothetical protein